MDLQASTSNTIKQGLPSQNYSLPSNVIPGQYSQSNAFSRQIPSRVNNSMQQPSNQQQLGLHFENVDVNENQITQNLQINQQSAAIGSYDVRQTRTESDQGQELRRNSAPLEVCKNENNSRIDAPVTSGAQQNKKGICSDPSSRFFILEQFVEPIYQDFVFLTENVLNKNMKSANKQLQDTLMNYFLENHVSNLIIKDMNCISKRAVRCEIEKSMIKTKTAKYMNLLNAFEGKVKLFGKEKHYENLLMNLISDENSGAKDSEQWKTLVRKRILALLLYVHWQTLDADQIFNDFFAIWDRIYPNHPLPQKAKKSAGSVRGQEFISRAYSEQLNPIGQQRQQQQYDIGMNKQMKRNKQKTIDTMNLSQSSLSSQITYGYMNSNTNNHTTPSTSSLFQPYQQILPQQQSQIPPKNQGVGVNPNQQSYSQQQYAASFQPRLIPQAEQQSQKLQQQIYPNQVQEGTGLIPLQGSSTFAYYQNSINGYQQTQSQQQWAQSRQQMEIPLDDLTNYYQTQTSNEQGIYQQSNQNQQISQALPVPNARPAKQVLKGRMRSQSWDDQGYKKEDDRYIDKQSLLNNNNNNYSNQSVVSDLAQINSDVLLGQFGSMQQQQQQQHQGAQSYQFYSQNAYDIPSMDHVDALFEPQYAQTQQSYYVDYSHNGMNQQPSNTNQFLDPQQQRQPYQQQQQQQPNNSQFVNQNSYFQTANPYLNNNYNNNVQYQPIQQQQPQLQQQQYQPQVQRIPFISSQMCDIKDVKQEATPPSESGNNSNSNRQFYQLDKIILNDPETPVQKKDIPVSQIGSVSGQYATQNHTQMQQQQQQQYSVQYSQQPQQQQYQKSFNSHPLLPQLQQQSPLPEKNRTTVSANIYQQQAQPYQSQQLQQPSKLVQNNQPIQGHQQQMPSFSATQEGNNYQHNAASLAGQEVYDKSSYSYNINSTKQEDDSSYLAQNIYDNQPILQQRSNPTNKIIQKGAPINSTSKQDQQVCTQQPPLDGAVRQASLSMASQQQQGQYGQISTKLEDLDSNVNTKSKQTKDTLTDNKQAKQPQIVANSADKQTNQSRANSKQQKQEKLNRTSKLENTQSQQKQQQTLQQQQDQGNSLPIKKGQMITASLDDCSRANADSQTAKEQQTAERNESRYSQLIYEHDLIREDSKDSDHSSNTNININQVQDGQFSNEQQEQEEQQIDNGPQEIQKTKNQENIHNNINPNEGVNNNTQLEGIQQQEQQQNIRYPLPYSNKDGETNHADIYQDYHNPGDGYISGNQNVSESNLAMMGSSLGVGGEGEKLFTRNGQRQNTGASYMSIESEKMSFKRSDTRNMTGLSNFSIESDKDQRTPQGANRSRFFFNRQNSLEYPPVIGMRSTMRNDTGISNTSENNPNELGGSTMQPQFYSKRTNFKEFSGISHISLEGDFGCLQGTAMMNSQTPRQGGFSAMNRSQQRKRANFSVDSLGNYNLKAEKDIQNLSVDLDNLNINQQGNRHFGGVQDQVIQSNQNVLDELKSANNNNNTTNQSTADTHNNNNNNNNLFFQYAANDNNNINSTNLNNNNDQ